MGESFLKREIEGTLPAQLDEAEAWLARNTLHAVELRGMTRTDREEYPREPLREALLNALVHRDYGLIGDRIRVMLYSDRVEISSPGALGGPMSIDTLLTRRWSRNPTLVQGFVALDLIEELGFGLDRMIAAMKRAGLRSPEFKEVGDTFVVTLYGPGDMLLKGRGMDEPRVVAELGRRPAMSRDERHAWVLNYVRMVGPLSPRDYVAALDLERRTAIRDLRVLEERGLITAHGTTTDRRYTLRHDGP